MLTPSQVKLLEDLGFKKSSVKVKEGHTYYLWEIEFLPNDGAPLDAFITVHIIDGKIRQVQQLIDRQTNDLVRAKYDTTLAKLKEGGIE